MAGRHLSPGKAGRTFACGLFALCLVSGAAQADALPRLGLDPETVTVSGVSSGGYMAHQLHVAHAARIKGAGVIAGGPWFCAGSGFPRNLVQVFARCMNLPGPSPFLGPPDVAPLLAEARRQAAAGAIDDPAELAGSRVFLFSGAADTLVPRSVVAAVGTFYAAFIKPEAIYLESSVPAPHAMVTLGWGGACEATEEPFINDCGYDLAGAILKHMYGALADPGEDEPVGELIAFDQAPFVPPARASGLAEGGYLFVPPHCRAEGRHCRLHVALHGCAQSVARIGEAFVRHAGYNRWAAANDIVVLYPQAAAVERSLLGVGLPWPNPQGCWDWWGFTGRDYALRSAPQITAIVAMIDGLLGDQPSPRPSPARAGEGGDRK